MAAIRIDVHQHGRDGAFHADRQPLWVCSFSILAMPDFLAVHADQAGSCESVQGAREMFMGQVQAGCDDVFSGRQFYLCAAAGGVTQAQQVADDALRAGLQGVGLQVCRADDAGACSGWR